MRLMRDGDDPKIFVGGDAEDDDDDEEDNGDGNEDEEENGRLGSLKKRPLDLPIVQSITVKNERKVAVSGKNQTLFDVRSNVVQRFKIVRRSNVQ